MYWISTVPSEIRQLNLDLLFDQIIVEEQILNIFYAFCQSTVMYRLSMKLNWIRKCLIMIGEKYI